VIVTIHQPEHLPWLGFFNKIDQADLLVLLDVVQYRKGYFQNRNRILGPRGPLSLVVPVLLKGHMERTLRDMEIHNGRDWRRKHWKTIQHAYGRHPHFPRYESPLADLYRAQWSLLVELNAAIIRTFIGFLGIDTKIVWASELGVQGSRSELLVSICRATGASTYLSGPTGRDYLDESSFQDQGIEVRYHAFDHPRYRQLASPAFVPNLSTLDLLCNCGPESMDVIRSGTG
jgi:hypothetical protein